MTDQNLESLKFPIGRFVPASDFTTEIKEKALSSIRTLPEQLKITVSGWNESQLDTPYRDGGWTVRQLVHHIADSHINAFTRFKLGLTEEKPTIRPYDQDGWCNMDDEKNMDIAPSLSIIEGVHARWSHVLSQMSDADYKRWIHHPEMKKDLNLEYMTGLYGWHCDHHLAHIQNLGQRQGWT